MARVPTMAARPAAVYEACGPLEAAILARLREVRTKDAFRVVNDDEVREFLGEPFGKWTASALLRLEESGFVVLTGRMVEMTELGRTAGV